jgi:hypothetical protein
MALKDTLKDILDTGSGLFTTVQETEQQKNQKRAAMLETQAQQERSSGLVKVALIIAGAIAGVVVLALVFRSGSS